MNFFVPFSLKVYSLVSYFSNSHTDSNNYPYILATLFTVQIVVSLPLLSCDICYSVVFHIQEVFYHSNMSLVKVSQCIN